MIKAIADSERKGLDNARNIIRKRKRFSPWLKASEVENLDVIKEYYGYSDEKAKSVLSLFNNKQIENLKQRIYKGGRTKTLRE